MALDQEWQPLADAEFFRAAALKAVLHCQSNISLGFAYYHG